MTGIAAYVICTSPRSGSTLLCDLLRATGVAGNPESWFHRPSLDEWAKGLEVMLEQRNQRSDVSALFEAAQELGSGGGDLFGLRLQRDSVDFFFEALRSLYPSDRSDLECFEGSFGRSRFIHLAREDKVAQAVSCVRAMQSGLWHVAADGSERERVAPHQDPHYDAAAIREHVEVFTEADRQWTAWFRQQGIEPIRISYSRLAAEPTLATRDVLSELGLDPANADDASPNVSKLADATSQEWIDRFRSER